MENEKVSFKDIYNCLNKFRGQKVFVLGDTIVDSYIETEFIGEAAVCFSKDAKWYSGAGNFVAGGGGDISVDQTMFLCIKADDIPTCAVDERSGEPTVVVDNVFL